MPVTSALGLSLLRLQTGTTPTLQRKLKFRGSWPKGVTRLGVRPDLGSFHKTRLIRIQISGSSMQGEGPFSAGSVPALALKPWYQT